jgi:enoyl-CoA hydratase
MKLARSIASRAPVALRLGMEAINRGINMNQQDGEIMECDMFGLASTTADMKEGMAAFLEKRPAKFTGK